MPRLLPLPRLRPSAPDTDRALVGRFAATSDPAAFAELVRRHGPLVLGVCRRAARDPDLADDAFQATFLVLARKVGAVRNPDALHSWLFGVARKVATAARRREERHAQLLHRAAASVPPPSSPSAWDDLLVVLDEELARLPDRYRAPLLACYLDGRTQDEAARQLGWSVSTLRRRLEAGRARLRVRLTARGATLGGGLVAGVVVPATAAVPGSLARAAVESAAGGVTPARVLALAAGGVSVAKWAVSAAVLLVTGGLAIGLGTGGVGPRPQLPSPGPLTPRFVVAPVPADAHGGEFEALWADLAKDEPVASRALLKLSARPKEAVAFLGKKVKPLTITPARVKQLIVDLGSDKTEVWKAAFEEFEYYDPRLAIDLVKLMDQVTDSPARQRLVAVLSGYTLASLEGKDVQVWSIGTEGYNFTAGNGSWWAEHRMERINIGWSNPKPHWTRAVRAIALLEHIDTPAAVAVLRDVATGHPDAQPTRTAKQALGRLTNAAPVPADVGEREFEALWADLVKTEPAASRALLKLSAKPKEAVVFLGKKMKPLTITPERVKQLIVGLGSDKTEVWKAAFEEFEYYDPRLAIDLVKLMDQVTDNPARQRLVAVLGDFDPENPEIRKRDTIQLVRVDEKHYIFSNEAGKTWWAEHQVERINIGWSNRKPHWTRAVRAIALLEHIGTPAAVAVLKDVATGHPDAQPTRAAKQALQRLAGAK